MVRLLFIGLWNFCDDAGRGSVSAKRIKAQIFPGDDLSSETILGMLDELARHDLIRFYSVDDKDYFYVTGWGHQRIDKRQPPKFPDPPSDGDTPSIRSFADHSTNDPGTVVDGAYLKGREGRGREQALPPDGGGEPEEPSPIEAPTLTLVPPEPEPSTPPRYPPEFQDVWNCYRETIGNPNAKKWPAYCLWRKLGPADRADCERGLTLYCEWLTEERKKRVDYPAQHLDVWIRGRGWESYLENAA